MLPLWAGVDVEPMSVKSYSDFPKASALLEPRHQIVSYIQDTRWEGC